MVYEVLQFLWSITKLNSSTNRVGSLSEDIQTGKHLKSSSLVMFQQLLFRKYYAYQQ